MINSLAAASPLEIPEWIWQADYWRYLNEGNIHMVFAYTGPSHPALSGHTVLRIAKEMTLGSSELSSTSISSQRYPMISQTPEGAQFATNFIRQLFGQAYTSVMRMVAVGPDFLQDLDLSSFLIRPHHRRHRRIQIHQPMVLLMDNYTSSVPSHIIHQSVRDELNVTVEIKPKWGALPSLEYLDDRHRHIKARVCRYCMHKEYKLHTKKLHHVSAYCPLDLYSGDVDRMRRALCALMDRPQNNFRVFKGGSLLVRFSLFF